MQEDSASSFFISEISIVDDCRDAINRVSTLLISNRYRCIGIHFDVISLAWFQCRL